MDRGPLNILPVGARCFIGGDIEGVVSGISIRHGNNVRYEVSWWDGRQHRCEWLEVFEVAPIDNNRQRVGFLSS